MLFRKRTGLLVLFLFLLGGGFFCKKTADPLLMPEAAPLLNDSVSFIVMGDWGRYGHLGQKQVAAQMHKYGKLHNVQFVITTGDNFYPIGVSSVTDVHWQRSFENVYIYDSLPVKWYPVLGNHDYMANPQAQIDYSANSSRWTMPARYHALKQKVSGLDSVLLVFADTNPFIPYHYGPDFSMADLKLQDTAVQTRWLQSTLKTSNDRWKIVIGHHPFYSVGEHGNNPALTQRLKPLLLQHQTDFYIAGHDHDLQHHQQPGEPLHYIVSGGGSENRSVQPQSGALFAKAVPGFLVMTLYSEKAKLYFYDKDGALLYERQINKP